MRANLHGQWSSFALMRAFRKRRSAGELLEIIFVCVARTIMALIWATVTALYAIVLCVFAVVAIVHGSYRFAVTCRKSEFRDSFHAFGLC